MNIRRARQSDALALAPLILASGPETLAAILNINTDLTALKFLSKSLTEPEGQYGYLNHWVAVANLETVACVSTWHNKLSAAFHQATLSSLLEFYGTPHVHNILRNSLITQDCIPKPAANEWCVGHLSVTPKHQGQGYGKALLDFVEQQAVNAKKTFLSLDVAVNNTQALAFYERQGFAKSTGSGVTQRMLDLGIGAHWHLLKELKVS
ncbi:GNAT family N-acetyltransferase [uncultured Paraglaciecola sp.]|uniref:GNAT family N-acetyltransferase n=1 Tax=uncultured Paraglaciecola sp. TaxID=1765024 RepID=UPI00259A1271|nr:GNAT family N-acetyltransferase [uncultured Paraglaciecola sp.]